MASNEMILVPSGVIAVPEPPAEDSLGPAMLALNERQRIFVIALLEQGTISFSRAAKVAGYLGDDATMRTTGHRLAHTPIVQAAVQEEARKRLYSGGIMAVSGLLEIAENRSYRTSDRLKAIEMILNRTGFHEKTEHTMNVIHRMSDEDKIKELERLALKFNATDILAELGRPVQDAEFEDVGTSDGLEDLLGAV